MKYFSKVFVLILALSVAMMSFPLMAMADVGYIQINNLSNGDSVSYLQLVEPDPTKPTGWAFTEDWIGDIFQTSYGITSADEDYQDTITALQGDYEGNVNGAAVAGSRNASESLRNALSAVVNAINTDGDCNYGGTSSAASGGSATGGAHATFNYTNDISSHDGAGIYLIHVNPAGSGSVRYVYDDMVAYVSFGTYDTTTGLPGNLLPGIAINAKRSENVIKKELGDGNSKWRSPQLGRPDQYYKVTCTFPSFGEQYWDSAYYAIEDTSDNLRNYYDIYVYVGSVDDNHKLAELTTASVPTSDANPNGYYVLEYLYDDTYEATNPATYNQAYNNGFRITFLDGTGDGDSDGKTLNSYNASMGGQKIIITYRAAVTSFSDGGKVINTATSTTINDYSDLNEEPWITKSQLVLDTYEIVIKKTDEYGHGLAGAEFACYYNSTDGLDSNHLRRFALIDGVYYYVHDNYMDNHRDYGTSSNNDVMLPAYNSSSIVSALTTDSDGLIRIRGLAKTDAYWFREKAAPAGYSLNTYWHVSPVIDLADPVQELVVVDGVPVTRTSYILDESTLKYASGSTDGDGTSLSNQSIPRTSVSGFSTAVATMNCVDTRVFALPSTGALGAYIFSFLGTACMSAAVILFLREGKLKGKFKSLPF